MSGRWRVERIPDDDLGWWYAIEPNGWICWMWSTWRKAFDYADERARTE
jgi:hypothetical protein